MKIPLKVLTPLLAGGAGFGFCLGMVLIIGAGLLVNLGVAALLGLVAHHFFPQLGYWLEVALIFGAALLLSAIAGSGA